MRANNFFVIIVTIIYKKSVSYNSTGCYQHALLRARDFVPYSAHLKLCQAYGLVSSLEKLKLHRNRYFEPTALDIQAHDWTGLVYNTQKQLEVFKTVSFWAKPCCISTHKVIKQKPNCIKKYQRECVILLNSTKWLLNYTFTSRINV